MNKEAGAYRTIGEVAAELDLPQHVLRFWETRFPAIRPLKRAGGRRFYRPNDVALLRDIRVKLYDEGYTIKGVQRLLRERGGKVSAAAAGDAADDCRGGVINDFSEGADHASPAAEGESPASLPHDATETVASGTARETLTNPPEDGMTVAALREALNLVEACERRLRSALAASA